MCAAAGCPQERAAEVAAIIGDTEDQVLIVKPGPPQWRRYRVIAALGKLTPDHRVYFEANTSGMPRLKSPNQAN